METTGTDQENILVVYQGKEIAFDPNGYLIKFSDWSEGLVKFLCERDGVVLTEDHWEVIRFMREYYVLHKITPLAKLIAKKLNEKNRTDKFSVKYLYQLFPPTPVRHACRYAGIPEPSGCI